MRQVPLLTFHEVVVETDTGGRIGPIAWTLHRAQRVWLETGNESQFVAFSELLSGRARPVEGYIEELNPVRAQSDYRLRESIVLNRSITDYLNTSDVPEHVWLENRRRSVQVLLDRLGLSANHFRLPLKFQSDEVMEKFAAFRFVVSGADLLVGGRIFDCADLKIRKVLKMRWSDFPGSVIACTQFADLPGEPDTHVQISVDGGFTSSAHQSDS